jgi:O-antigen ligase
MYDMAQLRLKFKFGSRSDFAARQAVRVLEFLEQVYVVIAIVLYTGVIANLLNQGVAGDATSRVETVVAVIAAFIMIPRLIIQRKEAFLMLSRSKSLLLFVGLICGSVLWSQAPGLTLRSLVIPLRLTVFALYLSLRFSINTQLRLIAWSLGIGAVLSLFLGTFVPSYGVMGADFSTVLEGSQEEAHMGSWKGAYGHKNPLSRAMSLGTIVFLLLAAIERRKVLLLSLAGLCITLVILSSSKTGLVVLVTLLGLFPLYRWVQLSSGKIAVCISCLVLLVGLSVLVMVGNSDVLFTVLGRDATLTGRTDLWDSTWQQVMQHPWLGYGYNAFWKTTLVLPVWNDVGWKVPHSHNGFLDLCIDVGLVGLLIFLTSLLSFCIRAIQYARTRLTFEGVWPLMFLSIFVLYNMTESSILRQGYIYLIYSTIMFSSNSIKSEPKL